MEPSFAIDLTTTLLPAFEGMITNVIGLMSAVLPIGLTIFAVQYGVKKAKDLLK